MTKTIKCVRCHEEKPLSEFRVAGEYYKYPTMYGRVMHCGCKKKKPQALGVGLALGGANMSNMGVQGCYRFTPKHSHY